MEFKALVSISSIGAGDTNHDTNAAIQHSNNLKNSAKQSIAILLL